MHTLYIYIYAIMLNQIEEIEDLLNSQSRFVIV